MRAASGWATLEEQHQNQRRLRRLEFADITPAWFEAHIVEKAGGRDGACWLADAIQVTVGGHRVYMARLAILLHQGKSITSEALATLRRHRCRWDRRCVNPDHALFRPSRPSRAEAIRALMADLDLAAEVHR